MLSSEWETRRKGRMGEWGGGGRGAGAGLRRRMEQEEWEVWDSDFNQLQILDEK